MVPSKLRFFAKEASAYQLPAVGQNVAQRGHTVMVRNNGNRRSIQNPFGHKRWKIVPKNIGRVVQEMIMKAIKPKKG
ncbi:MAG: hypothetical protein EOP14_05600 [Pseudomonas sp.]|jgi:hypothetical protein|nr:MAG: hypothetical protein EOP14_05600 [Pseudomonas sp.]